MKKYILLPVLLLLFGGFVHADETSHIINVSGFDRLVLHVAGTEVGTTYSSTGDTALNYSRALAAVIQANDTQVFGKQTINDGASYIFLVCPYSENAASVMYNSNGTLADDCNYPEIGNVIVDNSPIGNALNGDSVIVYAEDETLEDNAPASTSSVLSKPTTIYCTGIEADRTFQVRIIQGAVENVVYPYRDTNGDIFITDSTSVVQDWVRPTNSTDVIAIPYMFDSSFSQGSVTVRCESIGLPVCQADGEAPCVVGS